jgi:hypothetical protein
LAPVPLVQVLNGVEVPVSLNGLEVPVSLNAVKVPVSRRVKIPSFDLDISSEEESDCERWHAVKQPQPQEAKSVLPQPQHQPQHQPQQPLSVQILPAPKRQEHPSQTTPSQALVERQYQQQPGGEKTDRCQQSSASCTFVRQQEVKTQARSKIPSFDLQVSSDSEEDRNDAEETTANVRDFEQCADGKQRARVSQGHQSVSLPLSTHAAWSLRLPRALAEANAAVPILKATCTAKAHASHMYPPPHTSHVSSSSHATAKAHASPSQGGHFSQGDAIISLSAPPIFGAAIFISAC